MLRVTQNISKLTLEIIYSYSEGTHGLVFLSGHKNMYVTFNNPQQYCFSLHPRKYIMEQGRSLPLICAM